MNIKMLLRPDGNMAKRVSMDDDNQKKEAGKLNQGMKAQI